jgi:hypothetical protein
MKKSKLDQLMKARNSITNQTITVRNDKKWAGTLTSNAKTGKIAAFSPTGQIVVGKKGQSLSVYSAKNSSGKRTLQTKILAASLSFIKGLLN